LRKFEILIENKHMDTNEICDESTGNADNEAGLRTMSGQEINQRELSQAWHLLNVLCLNMMDDGPTWPRVLEWLRRNEQFRPEKAIVEARADTATLPKPPTL
jgi:hypothetical protein